MHREGIISNYVSYIRCSVVISAFYRIEYRIINMSSWRSSRKRQTVSMSSFNQHLPVHTISSLIPVAKRIHCSFGQHRVFIDLMSNTSIRLCYGCVVVAMPAPLIARCLMQAQLQQLEVATVRSRNVSHFYMHDNRS